MSVNVKGAISNLKHSNTFFFKREDIKVKIKTFKIQTHCT